MLNKLLKIMFLMISLCMINSTSAVIFSGEALKADNITIAILGDLHIDISPEGMITKKQFNDLLSIAKKYGAYLAVEDSLSRTGLNYPIKITIGNHGDLFSPLSGLCNRATQEKIGNINIECRDFSSVDQKKIIQKFILSDDISFKKYLHDFQRKKTLTHIDILDLNAVYEISKNIKTKPHKLYIIAVGAGHMRGISQALQNILPFKVVLQKNYSENQDYIKPASSKEINYVNQNPLDLPQFIEEALKAQPIRSRL